MVAPIGPKSPIVQSQAEQLAQKAKALMAQISEFHDSIERILADPSQVDQTETLYHIAESIKGLQTSTLEAKQL